MKTARTWFVLLLAVLLPLRGAVAAAMLCPVAGSGVQVELAMVDHSVGHEVMDHAQPHDHAVGDEYGQPDAAEGHTGHDHSATDKCNMCSAFCSLTPLVSELPTVAEPLDVTAVNYLDLSAPPPNFFSGRQERPPRTI